MIFQYSVTIQYINGKSKVVKFFTAARANEFRKSILAFKEELEIATVGEVIDLHPTSRYFSPFIVQKVETYLASLK